MTIENNIKKKRVNSKNKGSSNERKIASILSTHLAPLQFIRTPGSGAFVGGKNFIIRGNLFAKNAMQVFVGDIFPSNEEEVDMSFNFVIEAKHYKTPDSFDSLFTGKHNVYQWLNEVSTDCVKIGKEGIVIFKWNNTPYYCAVRNHIELPCEHLILPTGDKICYFTSLIKFKDFWCTPNQK